MAKETILIIGASGNNGTAAIHAIQTKHVNVRAAVRSDQKGAQLKQQFAGVETVTIDLVQPATLNVAFKGIDKVYIIPGNVKHRATHAKHAIDAAVSANVKQVVLLSVVGAEYEAILFAKQFREAEKHLEASGLNWTHLRTIWFQENFLGWAKDVKAGTFHLGIRYGKFAPLSITDIGKIAANILTTTGHNNKAYNITGPALLSGKDIANIFSKVTGKAVTYISPSPKDSLNTLINDGWPEWQAKGVVELFEIFASNQAAIVSPDGEQLLGAPLTHLSNFISTQKAAFINKD